MLHTDDSIAETRNTYFSFFPAVFRAHQLPALLLKLVDTFKRVVDGRKVNVGQLCRTGEVSMTLPSPKSCSVISVLCAFEFHVLTSCTIVLNCTSVRTFLERLLKPDSIFSREYDSRRPLRLTTVMSSSSISSTVENRTHTSAVRISRRRRTLCCRSTTGVDHACGFVVATDKHSSHPYPSPRGEEIYIILRRINAGFQVHRLRPVLRRLLLRSLRLLLHRRRLVHRLTARRFCRLRYNCGRHDALQTATAAPACSYCGLALADGTPHGAAQPTPCGASSTSPANGCTTGWSRLSNPGGDDGNAHLIIKRRVDVRAKITFASSSALPVIIFAASATSYGQVGATSDSEENAFAPSMKFRGAVTQSPALLPPPHDSRRTLGHAHKRTARVLRWL